MTTPISDEDRDRFLRELIANSPDGGITPAEQAQALRAFIGNLIIAASIELWHEGRMTFGWRDGDLIWKLTDGEVTA